MPLTGLPGTGHPRTVGTPQQLADALPGGDQCVEVDAGGYVQPVEHVQHVFAGDITLAPLAYGQPPRPATELSNTAMPSSRLA